MPAFFKQNSVTKFLLGALFMVQVGAQAQNATPSTEYTAVDTEPFQNSAHHWYDIFDKSNVINPRANQPRYKPTQLTEIADNILLYQKDNGGWPKNYDMLAILTSEQKDSLLKVKNSLHTTFDNSTTYSHIVCLANVYHATHVEKYKDAALKGLDFILSAQYQNGGWPQYFPIEAGNYSRHITFNDEAYSGIMWLLIDIVENKPAYAFVDKNRREKVKKSFDKGLSCIIKSQIVDNGKPTAWCQQYDETSLQPAWARAFEPPSICNAESTDIVLLLMSIQHPNKDVINAVQNAVAWFQDSKIAHTRVKVISAPEIKYTFRLSKTDRVVVDDPQAPPIWTRYYEIGSHKPLFCNRDSKVVYSLAEVDRERRDGYGWYTYEPQKVLDQYQAWQQKWAIAQNMLKK